MTADLAGELDRLDKAATPGPWEPTPNDGVLAHLEPPEDVPGMHRIAEAVYSRDLDLVVWLRNHTDEIKAALAERDAANILGPKLIQRAEAAEAERDRLVLHKQRMNELLDESEAEVERMRADLAAGRASDGYHTHAELYEFRLLYNAHAAHGWHAAGIPVVKSWRHSDGELCFGGGWFVVVADLPTGQVTNHYEAKDWGLFRLLEVELAPEWDGHTAAQAAERLRAALNGGE